METKLVEGSLLHSLFLSNNKVAECVDMLPPSCFSNYTYELVYKNMVSLFEERKRFGREEIYGLIKESKGFDERSFDEIFAQSPSSNIKGSIDAIRESHTKKELIEELRSRIDTLKQGESLRDFYSTFLPTLHAYRSSLVNHRGENYIDKTMDRIAHSIANGTPLNDSFSTGFVDLDNIMGGLKTKELVILGGRPSSGKTAFSLSLALKLAKRGVGVCFHSLEMSPESICIRLLSQLTSLSYDFIEKGELNSKDKARILSAMDEIRGLPFSCTADSRKIFDLRMSIYKTKLELPELKVVFVDYLQLLQSDMPMQKIYEEIGRVSMELKNIALELDISIIALSQLNRASENRDNSCPQLSDLKESSVIEQVADKIVFLYKKEKRDKKRYNNPQPLTDNEGIFAFVAKNRNGAIGETALSFNKESMLFFCKKDSKNMPIKSDDTNKDSTSPFDNMVLPPRKKKEESPFDNMVLPPRKK